MLHAESCRVEDDGGGNVFDGEDDVVEGFYCEGGHRCVGMARCRRLNWELMVDYMYPF